METRSAAGRLDVRVAAQAGVTRSRARSLIIAGRVRVAGRALTKPGLPVAADAEIEIERPRAYVSRGGEKLAAALTEFSIDVRDRRVLDVGASTGGFTDCLLQRGAAHVVALDVGYGQLAWSLRRDPRVTVIERCNFRTLEPDALADRFDLSVADTSFISLRTIVARALAFRLPGAPIVALLKPQFEAGPQRLGGGGVVRDPPVHRAVLGEFRDALRPLDLRRTGAILSLLRGPAGNVEFLVRIESAGIEVDDGALDALAAPASE